MKKKDYLSGSFFFLLAVLLFFQSRGLAIWEETGPSEGFFPLALSILLGLLSLIILIQAYLRAKGPEEVFQILGGNKSKFVFYCGSFFIFGLIFPWVGYSLALTAFLVFILKRVEKQSWKTTLSVTLSSIVGSYVIFQVLFSIPLPEGILSPILQLLK